jgi:hypothetical protein
MIARSERFVKSLKNKRMIPGERLLRESRRAEQAGNPTRFDSIRKAIRTGLAAVEKGGQKGKTALALDQPTKTLPRLPTLPVEDDIRFSHVKCRSRENKELHPSRSPLGNLALVAAAFQRQGVARLVGVEA